MARRKTFRKRGRKQSSRRRRSLKGKGFMGISNPLKLPLSQRPGYKDACCRTFKNYDPIRKQVGCNQERCNDDNDIFYKNWDLQQKGFQVNSLTK